MWHIAGIIIGVVLLIMGLYWYRIWNFRRSITIGKVVEFFIDEDRGYFGIVVAICEGHVSVREFITGTVRTFHINDLYPA